LRETCHLADDRCLADSVHHLSTAWPCRVVHFQFKLAAIANVVTGIINIYRFVYNTIEIVIHGSGCVGPTLRAGMFTDIGCVPVEIDFGNAVSHDPPQS
jgi:hypothetical protein